MQDNLARDFNKEVPDLKLHVSENTKPEHEQSPKNNIIDFSKVNINEGLPEDVLLIRKKIDAWLDLRVSIELDKIFNKLMVSKFNKMVEDTKRKYNDPRISEELDGYVSKMIDETKKKDIKTPIDLPPKPSDVFKVAPETPAAVNNNYQEKVEAPSSQKILTDGHFNSGNNANAA